MGWHQEEARRACMYSVRSMYMDGTAVEGSRRAVKNYRLGNQGRNNRPGLILDVGQGDLATWQLL